MINVTNVVEGNREGGLNPPSRLPLKKLTPAERVWIDISHKIHDAARDGDMERMEILLKLSKNFEKVYPKTVQKLKNSQEK
jgi:hypothetical protein